MPKKVKCTICDKKFGSKQIYNHYDGCVTERYKGESGCLVKFHSHDMFGNYYFIYALVGNKCRFKAIDKFLKDTWCECCGHLSEFREYGLGVINKKIKMNTSLDEFEENDKFVYRYDFGSTTTVFCEIINKFKKSNKSSNIKIVFRNNGNVIKCVNGCDYNALYFYDSEPQCIECLKKIESEDDYDENMLYRIVNSPRTGECGYE